MARISISSALSSGIDPTHLHFFPLDDEIRRILRFEFPFITFIDPDPEDFKPLKFIVPDEYVSWVTKKFIHIVYLRFAGIRNLFRQGYDNVLYVDADILFLRNPVEYLLDNPHIHPDAILVQDDNHLPAPEASVVPLPPGGGVLQANCCPGLALWRRSDAHLKVIARILRRGVEGELTFGDQSAFNALKGSFYQQVQLLPQPIFPNGAVLLRDRDTVLGYRPLHSARQLGARIQQ
jgi:lipopolysaccharide biosynthesis glycosyltransferase